MYGFANVNIGTVAVNDSTLLQSDIYIRGTIFGGGESSPENTSGFNWDAIAVTRGMVINIDGTGYTRLGFVTERKYLWLAEIFLTQKEPVL